MLVIKDNKSLSSNGNFGGTTTLKLTFLLAILAFVNSRFTMPEIIVFGQEKLYKYSSF